MKTTKLASTRIALILAALVPLVLATGCTVSSQSKTINTPPASLVSIGVGPANSNLVVDQTLQLSATGTYSDGSTQDITSLVSWSVTPSTAATISSSGLLTAQQSGQASISASYKSKTGSLQLTIAPKLVSIAINPPSATIAPMTTQQFIAIGTYSDNSTAPITGTVDWSSSVTSFATISDTAPTKGLATAVSAGTTTITATAPGVTPATATLKVTNATPTGLAITPNPASMALDVSQQFTATATFSDNSTQDVSNVAQWSSSSTQNATVTQTGLVTAKKVTSSPITISATFGPTSANVQLTINSDNLDSISISPQTGIAQGTKVQFVATGTFNDGSTHNVTSQVTWATSDKTILNFTSGSSAQGVAPGTVTVTATLGSVTGSTLFTVSSATIQSVTVTPSSSTIPIQGHESMSATGLFSDSTTQDITTSVTWSSDAPAIASVGSLGSSLGIVNGLMAGTANISAQFSAGGASATGKAPLTVSSATLQSISISPGSALVVPGSTVQFNAQGKWSDGSTQNLNQFVTWSIADTSGTNVATVSAGVVTGNSAGTAQVTAKSGSLSANASVVVEGSALNSVQVSPHTASVPKTIEIPFTAMGTFADGNQLDLTGAVTWTSSSPAIATVSNVPNSSGVATGDSAGSSTISAVFAGQSDSAALTVTNATLNSIAVTPANSSINLGASQQFTAKGTFSDGSVINLTGQVTWTSSDPAVAVIKSTGVANSASKGTTTIKASLNGVTGMTVLTVN